MKNVKNLKIAYIGGGSKAWARTLMNDLAKEEELAGTVLLYDINYAAAKDNEKIGNALSDREDIKGKWKYVAKEKIDDALCGADFVFISILPGTFEEMSSDVHLPEEYGIYQSVGDTVGPAGIIRSLRTVPMYEEFALAIKRCCPKAWVVNFTNPMTVCVRTLYKVFPEIKAIGCCHEVFGTKRLMVRMLKEEYDIQAKRDDIKINVFGVNHFTWVNEAHFRDMDLVPMYAKYVEEHQGGAEEKWGDDWIHLPDNNKALVKFDLYRRYGVIAAAGDRHLAEFCPGNWYLKDKETVEKFGFNLTTVQWRTDVFTKEKEDKTKELLAGNPFELYESGEEMVAQIKALLGLGDFVTNVNMPNGGQIPNLPLGVVVETNAYFSGDSIKPIFAGEMPKQIAGLTLPIIAEQEAVVEAGLTGNYDLAFSAFVNSPNMTAPLDKAREMFDRMLYNTRNYLPFYEQYMASKNK